MTSVRLFRKRAIRRRCHACRFKPNGLQPSAANPPDLGERVGRSNGFCLRRFRALETKHACQSCGAVIRCTLIPAIRR
jgi:hypothetical protein